MFQMSSLVTHRQGLAALKAYYKILNIIQHKSGALREVEYVADRLDILSMQVQVSIL